jgi:hypothetical protein
MDDWGSHVKFVLIAQHQEKPDSQINDKSALCFLKTVH